MFAELTLTRKTFSVCAQTCVKGINPLRVDVVTTLKIGSAQDDRLETGVSICASSCNVKTLCCCVSY